MVILMIYRSKTGSRDCVARAERATVGNCPLKEKEGATTRKQKAYNPR